MLNNIGNLCYSIQGVLKNQTLGKKTLQESLYTKRDLARCTVMHCQKLLSLPQNVMLIFYQSFVMLFLYCCYIKGLYLNLNVKYIDKSN